MIDLGEHIRLRHEYFYFSYDGLPRMNLHVITTMQLSIANHCWELYNDW